ncbi:hypothetical protein HAX54_017768, partial [Datura stramonium]|nr:hypothetical protein [Datura stramonium]
MLLLRSEYLPVNRSNETRRRRNFKRGREREREYAYIANWQYEGEGKVPDRVKRSFRLASTSSLLNCKLDP